MGTAVGVGLSVAESTTIGKDPTEIIRDSTARYSLADKQQALLGMWSTYERHGSRMRQSEQAAIRRELWINSNIVYNECLEAKSVCEKWKVLLEGK